MPEVPFKTSIDDLDTMLCAVASRLRGVGEASAGPAAATAIEANDRLCRVVLECSSALEQLHTMLSVEVERQHVLELFVSEARAALARRPAELAPVLSMPLPMPLAGGPREHASAKVCVK